MFLATKIEDVYHIPLVDFVNRVGHKKFNDFAIKSIEAEILDTLKYHIYFATHLNHLNYLFFRAFNYNDKYEKITCTQPFTYSPQLQNIFETSVYVLRMCVHDYPLMQYASNVLAAVALGYSMHQYFQVKAQMVNKPAV